MDDRQKSKIQEELVALYLRLNGYFVSRLIVHSPTHGRISTEIDALAVRFPFSSEFEREMTADSNLNSPTRKTDLLICEVKSRGRRLRFNDALVSDSATLEKVISWAGVLPTEKIPEVAEKLRELLSEPKHNLPATVNVGRRLQIRGIIFSPENKTRRSNQPWHIDGTTIIEYAFRCLRPTTGRARCSTTYDVQAWGNYEALVRYFKTTDAESSSIQSIYDYIEGSAIN